MTAWGWLAGTSAELKKRLSIVEIRVPGGSLTIRCSRLAIVAIYNLSLLAKVGYRVTHLAHSPAAKLMGVGPLACHRKHLKSHKLDSNV